MELSEQEILLGKHLMANKSDVFVEKWTKEIQNWRRVLSSIEQAEETSDIVAKRKELLHLIELVKGALPNENR